MPLVTETRHIELDSLALPPIASTGVCDDAQFDLRSHRAFTFSRGVRLMRVVTLNVNHRTQRKEIPAPLVDGLFALEADVMVLTEYVEPKPRQELRMRMRSAGRDHIEVSTPIEYRPGKWSNQVLIASRWPTAVIPSPKDPPNDSARSNYLRVKTGGIDLVGIRVPMYELADEWYDYWRWLQDVLGGDLIIGDLNVDPARSDRRSQVLSTLMHAGGWARAEPEGAWSYSGQNGNTSRVDHALFRGAVQVTTSRYVAEPFVPEHTDHAALVIDLEVGA